MSDYDEALRKVSDDMTARRNAADALKRAYMDVRKRVEPSGWVPQDNAPRPAPDHFLVGFAMRRDGRDVAECAVKVGPGRAVVFDAPPAEPIVGTTDTIGEEQFCQMLEIWAGEVQAFGGES